MNIDRVEVIAADNDRLKAELQDWRNVKKEGDKPARKTPRVEKKQPKKDSRAIPGTREVLHTQRDVGHNLFSSYQSIVIVEHAQCLFG